MVAGHLVAALDAAGVPGDIVAHTVEAIAPLASQIVSCASAG